ncbi:hypothetical protein FOZ63_024635 [Perkinsus olseni]|uniref:Uncharacterized protein n=1 Tax=Perkinsus olseni TaxID=32597 RepID=A0A7J6UIU5_PEROL|nr:hypothetical protein FOZ63_024635 [Perkinsus olseni]
MPVVAVTPTYFQCAFESLLFLMPSKGAVLGAAVQLLLSLPSGIAIGGVGPHNNAYPPLATSQIGAQDHAAYCFYTNSEVSRDKLASLGFKVTQSAQLRTLDIVCPKSPDGQDSFANTFTVSKYNIGAPYNRLYEYQPSFVQETKWQFKIPPPQYTGLDPFWSINVNRSTIPYKLSILKSAAEDLKGKIGEGKIYISKSDLRALGRLMSTRVANKRVEVCSLAMHFIKLYYGTFGTLCDEHRKISKNAVEAARNKGGITENSTSIVYG